MLNFATMESRQLTEPDNIATMRAFDIAPDGGEIVLDRQRQNSDVALIDLRARPKAQ